MKKITLFTAVLVLIPFRVFAATVTVVPEHPLTAVGQEVRLTVTLSADATAVNALEGTLVVPPTLSITSVEEGNSVMSLWVAPPSVHDHEISFSGLTPGGYAGNGGRVFSVLVKAVRGGMGSVSFMGMHAYANDGKGSEVTVTAVPLVLKIGDGEGPSSAAIMDKSAPETFVPTVGRDASLFNNRWFVAFATQDKGTGIDHYSVSESRDYLLRWFARPVRAESPHMLADQSRTSFIAVTAYDHAGNARTAHVAPLHIDWLRQSGVWLVLIILCGGFLVRRRMRF